MCVCVCVRSLIRAGNHVSWTAIRNRFYEFTKKALPFFMPFALRVHIPEHVFNVCGTCVGGYVSSHGFHDDILGHEDMFVNPVCFRYKYIFFKDHVLSQEF